MTTDLRIPFEPGPLFERTKELEEIRSAFEHPLITLVGPGGVGKTRIAIRLAHQVGRVAFCEFAAACDRTDLLQAVADAIGYSNAELTVEALTKEIRDKRVDRVIFDNAEHLLEEVTELASQFLKAHIRLLVTSREPLKLRSERVVAIRPFDVEQGTSFLEFYAHTRKPTWAPLLTQHASEVSEIVERLDGLPLALELVVGQLGETEPGDILQRLRSGETDDTKDREDRHASLHAILVRSWQLLSGDEKIVLVQLASFVDIFSRDAALSVIEVDGPAATMLANLVTKSLINVHERDDAFQMYKTVRDFVDRIDSFEDVRTAAHRRHAEYLLSHDISAHDDQQVVALRNDAIASFRRFRNTDPDLAGRLVVPAANALDSRIEYRTIIRLVDSALELPLTDDELIVLLATTRAVCLSRIGEVFEALEFLGTLDAEKMGTRQRILFLDAKAEIQRGLAFYEDAFNELQKAVVDIDTLDDPWLNAVMLGHLAIAAWCAEDDAAASEFLLKFADAVSARESEWPELAAYPDLLRAEFAFEARDFDAVTLYLDRAETFPSSGKRYLYQQQTLRGWLSYAMGDRATARAIWEEIGFKNDDETAKYSLAALWALTFLGDPNAVDTIEAIVTSTHDPLNRARLRFYQALLAAENAEFEQARAFLGSAERAAERLNVPVLHALTRLLAHTIDGDGATLEIGGVTLPVPDEVAWTRGGQERFLDVASAQLPSHRPAFVRWRGAHTCDLLKRVLGVHVVAERARHPSRILWVSATGEQVTIPGGETIDFAGRVSVARIVLGLAQHWDQNALSREALVTIGWPDEFVEEQAGANRVYTAIRTIRKFGLDRWLQTDDGYRFDPDTVVRIRT